MNEIREKIAKFFEIARQEGALRKYANGISDAEDITSYLAEQIKGKVLTDEELNHFRKKIYNPYKYGNYPLTYSKRVE